MYEFYFVEPDELSVFDGEGPAPEAPEWMELFGGIPSPDSAAFYGLCRFCQEHAAVVQGALPWLAAEIARNDGPATMLRFVRRWSGMRLYVPRSHARFAERVGCDLGASTHDQIVRAAGVGSQVEVPSAWGVFLALRRVAIGLAIRSRLPAEEISRGFGVTMRSLR